MSATFPYDAVESEGGICFVVKCPSPPARIVRSRMVPGRGVEISCGRWSMRASNLHPRLQESCATKPISVAAVEDSRLVVRGPNGVQAPLWKTSNFYWYLDATMTTTEELAQRPFPSALALGGRAVVVSALGSLPYGPPVGLCRSSTTLTALPPARVWHRVCGGLLVDQSLLDCVPPGAGSDGDIDDAVHETMRTSAVRRSASGSTWRPQMALLMSEA